jgi:AbrB family looped-hinge helix DNA binding protein
MAKSHFEFKNYGFTTIGERGQVVIPKEIRKIMKIKAGDKFLVFSHEKSGISLIKPEKFDRIIKEMTSHLNSFKKIKK